MATIAIIGSGFSGLSASAYLAQAGHEVHVFEKHAQTGGRARQLRTPEGYVFDMGPSWYWMPGVFEKFFRDFGHAPGDFYSLRQLDPGFEVVFDQQHSLPVPASFHELCHLFESVEKGSGQKLVAFMHQAERKYKAGMEDLVYMPGLSATEFMSASVIGQAFKLDLFSSFSKHIRKYFSHPYLLALMEFPVLFLGARPQDTPALYSLMNYAGLKLGTWYPEGGFGKVVQAMETVARKQGATFHLERTVEKVITDNRQTVTALLVNGKEVACDAVVAAADYHHVESVLLTEQQRNYDEEYWKKKTFAPSCLIFYLGVKKKLEKLNHHTLFFDEDLAAHAEDIYTSPKWPEKPLFYVCCPSKSDQTVAPPGHENLFLLMPLAPGLPDTEETREDYFKIMMRRLQHYAGEAITPFIDYKKSYCISNFIEDYNAYNGNAYGLANTLMQTAIFKPKIRNKKLKNLVYAGQLTVPGPGVPPSIISGEVAAQQLINQLKHFNR